MKMNLLTIIIGTNNDLLNLGIWFAIAALVFYLLIWLIGWAKLPDPWAMVAKVIVGVVAVIVIIKFLIELGNILTR
jgi:hypothetical protein